MAVQIVPSVLTQQVEEGMKLKPLAEHYNLPVAQMKKALKSLGLTIRKFHEPKFEFVTEATVDVFSNQRDGLETVEWSTLQATEENNVVDVDYNEVATEDTLPPLPDVTEEKVEVTEVTEEKVEDQSGW